MPRRHALRTQPPAEAEGASSVLLGRRLFLVRPWPSAGSPCTFSPTPCDQHVSQGDPDVARQSAERLLSKAARCQRPKDRAAAGTASSSRWTADLAFVPIRFGAEVTVPRVWQSVTGKATERQAGERGSDDTSASPIRLSARNRSPANAVCIPAYVRLCQHICFSPSPGRLRPVPVRPGVHPDSDRAVRYHG